MDLYSGIDSNGNLTQTSYGWHHDDQKNELNAMNATNALNFAQAKWQMQQDINFWNMQNEYNSPSNQLELLKKAGLNPLFYGSNLVGNSGASQLSAPNMANSDNTYQSQEQAKMANIVNMLGNIDSSAKTLLQNKQIALESRRLDLEKSKVDSELKYNEAKTAESQASAANIKETTNLNKNLAAEAAVKVDEARERLNMLKWDNKLYDETFQYRVNNFKFGSKLQEAGVVKSGKEAKLLDQEFQNAVKQGKILDYEEVLRKIEKENAEAVHGGEREKGKAEEKIGKVFNEWLDNILDSAGESYVHPNGSRSSRNPITPKPGQYGYGKDSAWWHSPADDYDRLRFFMDY